MVILATVVMVTIKPRCGHGDELIMDEITINACYNTKDQHVPLGGAGGQHYTIHYHANSISNTHLKILVNSSNKIDNNNSANYKSSQ